MSLYNEILSIQGLNERDLYYRFGQDGSYSYSVGHADALRSAAQIAMEGDRAIQLLSEIGDYYLDEIQSEDLVEKIKAFMEQR